MSIKCKLIGGFIGIAMLLLCVGLLGWGGVNSTASSLSQVVEYRLPAVQALMRIQYLVHSILGTQRALLNPGLGRETIEANYATLHKLAAELETVWNRYAEMPRSQEEEHFWSILQQTKKQRQDFNKQFIGLSSRLLDLDILDPVRFKKNLESYKSEFYKLVGNVGNMLQTEVEFAGGEDYRQSELGKWALKPGISNEVVRQALANVLAPLEKFYSAIAKAKGFIREGDIDAASFTYEAEITSAAEGIANQLSRLSTQADEAEALYDRMANLLMTQGRTLSRETFQAIDQLVVLNSEATEMEVARTVKNANIAGSLSLAGVGFGFVLAMLVGFGLTKNITRPLFAGIRFAQSVAKGDFTATLDVQRTDEAGVLADSLRTMVKTLKATIKQAEEKSIEAETEAEKAKGALEQAHFAKQESEKALYQGKVQAAGRLQGIVQEISVSTESLSEQIARMANGSEFQRSRSEKAVASVEQVNQMIQSVAHNAQHAADQSQTAGAQAKRGAAQVEEAIRSIVQVQSSILDLKQSMGNLAERTDDINSVLAMISDIADQTNLLALNAAIEAARAGEAGRGFAVVADEVRKLAEKTLEATRNVHDTVDGIQRFVLENVQATDKAAQDMIESTRLAQLSGKSMEEILQLVEDSFRQVHTIAQSCREQASLSEVTHQSVSEVYDVAVQTSKGVTICVASIDGLVNNSDKLRSLVDDLQKKEE